MDNVFNYDFQSELISTLQQTTAWHDSSTHTKINREREKERERERKRERERERKKERESEDSFSNCENPAHFQDAILFSKQFSQPF